MNIHKLDGSGYCADEIKTGEVREADGKLWCCRKDEE